ncbi:MAG: insulinase family protein [Flavobacteriales bacterium]|nr:insulinase family protein [Flavobacteriales bacterium]
MIELEVNRAQGPIIKELGDINLPKVEYVTLDNGIPVHIVNGGTQELLRVEAFFNKGIWDQDSNLIAALANNMLLEGTQALSAQELSENLDFLGTHIASNLDYHSWEVSIYLLKKHLEKSLELLRQVLYDSTFPESNFEIQTNRGKQQFLVNKEKVSYRARRSFLSNLFKSSPYGTVTKIEDFGNVKSTNAQLFYQNVFQPINLSFIVSCKVDDQVIQQLNKLFGQDEFEIVTQKTDVPTFQSSSGEIKNLTGKQMQAAVRIGSPCNNHTDPDFFKQKILTVILGGYFGSRLMNNIREDKGYTYGIGANMVNYNYGGYFFIATEVGIEFVDDTLKQIEIELKKLQNELVPSEELDRVKNYILGSIMKGLDGPLSVSDRFHGLLERGLNFEYYQNYINDINAVSSEDLLRIAQQKWDFDSLLTVIEG